jgi:hypothetical protein
MAEFHILGAEFSRSSAFSRMGGMEQASTGFHVSEHLRVDCRMKGDDGCSIFGDDLKRVKITRRSGRVKGDPNRVEDLMHDLPGAPETKGDHVVASVGFVKHHALECRARGLLGLDTIRFDDFQVNDCSRALLAELLAESRPIGTFYFLYHDMFASAARLSTPN